MTVVSRRRQGKSYLVANLIIQAYAKSFSEILVLSNTIDTDPIYPQALGKIPNVTLFDINKRDIDNDLLKEIWDRQKKRFKEDPKKNDLLIIFDDLGEKFKGREMRKMMNVYFQKSRHPKISFICCVQSINNCTAEQKSNTTQWVVFGLDPDALKKVSLTLATAEKDRYETTDYIVKNTHKKHSWIMIDLEAESDDTVYQAYDPDTNKTSAGVQ
ncbi:hypothetical protein HK097_007239 [Rhizophlyctis rosea]|uniref:Uncharacterized protein n=1 Tax=Rhizophlyctis rosea TaxID=64517 RepID=A0AAD5X4Q4_9FUNG|nr:hypothetical protein HK097_007239 [Rhizophlyctis rosea]